MLCKLYNLQTLDLSWRSSLRNLPQGMGKLIKLRHGENVGTPLSYMPTGIERCSYLALLLKQAMQDIDFQSLSSLIFPNLESRIEALQGKGNGSFQVTSCRMMADPITRHQGIVAGLPDSK
ncbi:hypothetical protein WN944_021847 [Citrus x changshan-huyou]|uniref:Uncharacterized protein n=1 Tax=Citrus x changshan-huyou TaxID=2935761 RepID=A0AAP0N2I9_9ROSI